MTLYSKTLEIIGSEQDILDRALAAYEEHCRRRIDAGEVEPYAFDILSIQAIRRRLDAVEPELLSTTGPPGS